jgi:hypothetical protein
MDHVQFRFSSSNSLSSCESSGRQHYALAAMNDGYHLNPLNATIVDDDTAGVLLSVATVVASFDNFDGSLERFVPF